MLDCCTKTTIGGAIAISIGIYLWFKKSSAAKHAKLQEEWNKAGKDVVVLHQFPRASYCPNPSPYPIKIETFLRMAGIKYINDFDEYMSPKGKSPWITFKGINVSDSQLAMEYLSKKLDIDLDKNLTKEQRAQSRAIRALLEDKFYFALVMDRWGFNEGKIVYTHFGKPPKFIPVFAFNFLIKMVGRKMVVPQAVAQGLGRHSQSELEEIGVQDLEAVSALLGNKPFIMGDQPTSVDLTLFGFMCMLLYVSMEECVYTRLIIEKLTNLKEHTERMKERFWSDWNDGLDN